MSPQKTHFVSRDVFFVFNGTNIEGAVKSLFLVFFNSWQQLVLFSFFLASIFFQQKSKRQVSGPATKIVYTVSDCMKVSFCRCYSNNKREWRREGRKKLISRKSLYCAHNWIKSINRCGLNGIYPCNVPRMIWDTTTKKKKYKNVKL